MYTYVDDGGVPVASLTYAGLDAATRALAQHLLRGHDGVVPAAGDRVLLVFLPSLDFIVAFLACLRAGLVAVPVYPPDPRRARAYVTAFAQIAASCGARLAVSHSRYLSAVSLARMAETATRWLSLGFLRGGDGAGAASGWPSLVWVDIDPVVARARAASTTPAAAAAGAGAGVDGSLDAAAATSLAFLQYTSGSTSDPKGVMLTHGNLAHNLATIVRSLEAGTDTVVTSWLPQYHDMGLIGSLLGILYCGGSGVYMSPLSFIKRPVLWMELAARYRATHIQSPNFGYKLVARKWREGARERAAAGGPPLDLSSIRHMFNAAEPITVDAIADFVATFAPFGLRAEAMKPGYGLAEHCVYVSDGGTTVLQIDHAAYERNVVVVVQTTPLLAAIAAPAAAADAPAAGAGAGAGTGGETSTSHSLKPMQLVSCGPVAPWHGGGKNADIAVAIADPLSCTLLMAPDAIGEVWLSSPSVAAGYWGQPAKTAEAFGVALAAPAAMPSASEPALASSSSDVSAAVVPAPAVAEDAAVAALRPLRYLRTGDLGFIHDGQLYICGRAKDLIIVRGKNYYPQVRRVAGGLAGQREFAPCRAAPSHRLPREESSSMPASPSPQPTLPAGH